MKSKDRILKTLNFEKPDRIPLDIGGTNVTSFHVEIEKKLKDYLGFSHGSSELSSQKMRAVIPDERILRHFNADTRCLCLHESRPWQEQPNGTYVDEWGIGIKRSPDGYYYEYISNPLKDASIHDIERYNWPDPCSEERIKGLEERAQTLTDYCLILEGTREPIFGLATWLRGYEQFFMDLVMNVEFVATLLDALLGFWKSCLDFVFSRIGGYIDIVKVADDLGTQKGLLMSPQMYRTLIKPRQAELYRFIKEKTGCKLLLHCDGGVRGIIPDFIEIGVDILNPIQPNVEGMDPLKLKTDFGDKIVFWGGGVDTQSTLAFGSPEDVKATVKNNMEILGKDGGYVFCQVHNILPEVPLENVLAMYEAYFENASY
jgi:uroporphyrinogen decarboxylase